MFVFVQLKAEKARLFLRYMGEDTWAQLQKAYPERLTEEMVWQTPDEGANGYASVYSALSAQIIYCRLICRFIAAGKKYKDEASRMSKVLKAKDAGQKKKTRFGSISQMLRSMF